VLLCGYLPLTGGTLTGTLQVIANINLLAGGSGSSFDRQISLGSGTAYNYQVKANGDDFQLIEAGSHVFLEYDYGGSLGNGTIRLYNNTVSTASVTATSFIRTGGTSSQYLMADGSVSTLSNPVTGTGTTNYLPKFTGASTIGNSLLSESGTGRINLYASSGFAELYVKGSGSTSGMYLFDQNTESGLWKVDSGYMAFATTNIEAMRIFSGQNVHIGPTPASDNGAKLQVSGTATFSSSVTATSLTTGTNSGSSINITTNNNNGTSGSPLQTNVNFYGYNGNLNGQIRVDDIAGTAQVGTGAATFGSSVTANGISSIGQEQAFTWQRTTGTASDVYSLNADSGSAYLYNNTTANILMMWSEGGNVRATS
jgi:hypothetical protein